MTRATWFFALSLWSAATTWGLWTAFEYERAPAELATPPASWPSSCALATDSARPTLLLFVHPKCPCTRATVQELDRLLARHPGRATVYAIVLRPAGVPETWSQTDIVSQVSLIPGVKVLFDNENTYQRLFHTTTSGECLLYSPEGKLRFHGGLTAGRGHEGYSQGQSAIAAILSNGHVPTEITNVYGCPLTRQPGTETCTAANE